MKHPLTFGCQAYPWSVYFRDRGLTLDDRLEEALAACAAAGLTNWEHLAVPTPAEAPAFCDRLRQHGLEMASCYHNAQLHDAAAAAVIADLVARSAASHAFGLRVLVVNPTPIRWGGPEDKDDTQLRLQAKNLDDLGQRLADVGVTLAYHTHAPEMRAGAREFHHMMNATAPEHVSLCVDAQWMHRGCGNSMVAVEDILRLYGDRVASLHVRQTRGGIWTEVVEDGEVDWRWIATHLSRKGFSGPVILEAAAEKGTPQALPMADAVRLSLGYVRPLFA